MSFQQANKDNYQDNINNLDSSQSKAVFAEADNVVIKAPAGSGKALRNGTQVLTSNGWKSIEQLTLEDLVCGDDGKFYNVTGVYPQGLKQIFQVEFSDGNVIECTEDHLWNWQTSDQRLRRPHLWQTSSISELTKKSLQTSNGHWDMYIPQCAPIQFTHQEVPIDGYLLGALLGDGNMSSNGLYFTVAEEDLKIKIEEKLSQYNCNLQYLSKYDYAIRGEKGFGYNSVQDYVGAAITQLGLRGCDSHTKFIPQQYLYNSEDIRLAVLQGLIDTDGYCGGSFYEFTLASKQLIQDIQFLCESLGFTATYSEKTAICSNGKSGPKNCDTVYRLYIKTSAKYPKIHTTKNKDSRWKKGQSVARRTIRNIIKTKYYDNATCISVNSPNHLFLTEHCIPTHNTHTLLAAVANYRYEHLNDRICAITFTRAARAEMEVRLREMGIYDVEVTTIHVWARNLLEYFADKYDFRITVMNETQIKQVLQDIVREYLVRARIRSININILYSYITGNKTMDVTDNYRRTLRALEERYIIYKRNNNLYDFTDYPLYLWDVMKLYDEYVNTIDALFVDELQDVDPIQFKIFERVNSNKKFFIGDAWQSIYVFRGSDGEIFEKLDDFHLCKLKYNYRSYQEIIDYASTVYMELYDDVVDEDRKRYITQIDWSNPSSIQCKKEYGGEVVVINPFEQCIVFKDNNRVIDNAYRQLRKIMELNPMILCRTNKQVKTIQEFGISNVSTIHQAKGLEYDNVIVIDTEINCLEDLNVAYVALTRAKDRMLVINFVQFENYLKCQENAF